LGPLFISVPDVARRGWSGARLGRQRLDERRPCAAALRSLSRLRGRAGVGVSPRFAPPEWRKPPPASHLRCDATSPASGRGKGCPRRREANSPELAADLEELLPPLL